MAKLKMSFQRYEKKYLLSGERMEVLWKDLEPKLMPDVFFQSTVCSMYYDWEDFRLIRESIEKPLYREKLRLRSYGVPAADGPVFLELKRKFKGIVYKRRVQMSAQAGEDYVLGRGPGPQDSQIARELDWFLRCNPVRPSIVIACERKAYVAREDPELRITFDSHIRWRDTELSLMAGDHGRELLEPGEQLMEIKMPGVAPLWLADMLSQDEVYPRGFSKYGQCYKQGILEKYFDGVIGVV